jgi:hypothetical protein
MACAATLAIAAEAAAFAVFRRTRSLAGVQGERMHFVSTASLVVGVLFLAIILLSGIGAVYLLPCRQG